MRIFRNQSFHNKTQCTLIDIGTLNTLLTGLGFRLGLIIQAGNPKD